MNQPHEGLDLAQPPGGYGPPPGGAPPGGWGPPPGGAPPGGWGPPPGGAPPGGWGPPGGGPPGGGAPPGGWGPPGGGPPPGGAPPGGWGPPGGPPGGAPPGGGWGPPGGPPPGGYGQPPGGYGAPPGGYGAPPGPPGYPPGPPGYPPGGGYPGGPGPGFQGAAARATFSPGDAITFAWERVKADPGTILATIIVGIILAAVIGGTINFVAQLIGGLAGAATNVATGGVSRHHGAPAADVLAAPLILALVAVGQLVSFVISTFFTAGIMNFSLKVARGAPYAFGNLFSGAPFFLSVLVANIIIVIGAAIGMVFLVVPGVILLLGLSMSMPLIVDRGLGPIDALKASWQLTDGNKGTIFIFGLIAFGLSIAGMCACFVGILLVIPIIYIAHMYIYLKLSGQQVAQAGPAV